MIWFIFMTDQPFVNYLMPNPLYTKESNLLTHFLHKILDEPELIFFLHKVEWF